MKEYQENLRALSLKESYSKEDLLTKEFLYAKDGKVEVYWAPFDYINKDAKVIILGITPGFTQMQLAFNYVRHHINEGEYEQVICDAKKQASFGGTVMRRNLIEMLDGIGLQELLHIPSCDQLFNNKHDLLHTTSILRYPVFIEGENYGGSNPKILSNDIFLRMIDDLLVPELNALKNAVIIPTGKAVSDVLKNLVGEGKIQNDNILFNFPHPSGANGHRKEQYETNKHIFKKQLAKLAALGVVEESHSRFIPTDGGEMAELIKQLKIIGEELKRSNDLKEKDSFNEKRLPKIADEIEPYDHRIALVIDHLLGK
ncbi:MAG: uracil-DNA glycosylase family protein [Bacillota bacterium]